jgi:spore coat protein CotH
LGILTHKNSVYWLHEDFDTVFLKDRYLEHKNSFYKCGVGIGNLGYLGDNPLTYKQYNVSNEHPYFFKYIYDKKGGDESYQDLTNLILLINKTEDKDFERSITGYFNVDRFIRKFIVEISVMNFDTYTLWNNNYILYFDQPNKRFEYSKHKY